MKKLIKHFVLLALVVGYGYNAKAQKSVVDIVNTIPNPIEVSALIKDIGASYNSSNLNNPDKADKYSNSYKKAVNLGVYSTDLGVANLYSKNQDVLNYLNAIKGLADGLNIGEFFDINTLKKYTQNSEQLPELLKLTTQNLEKINDRLEERKQDHISILLVAGSWIEANYLMTLVHKETKDKRIKDKIGEQKIILDEILAGLKAHKTQPNFAGLIADLEGLKKIYDKVKIETKKGSQKMEERNGELVIVDSTVSVVTISDADLTAIASSLASIRKKLVE